MQLCLTKAIWQMKVAIALEVPTEGKLCLSPPITPPLTGCISTQVLPVLHTQRRTIDVMLPDALAHPSPHQLQAALVPRFYQFFTLRDGPLMSCFQMKTACFELLPRLYLQYSLGISHYESYWSPSLSPMEGFLKGSAMVHFSPIVYE